jgi:hypothetical protein
MHLGSMLLTLLVPECNEASGDSVDRELSSRRQRSLLALARRRFMKREYMRAFSDGGDCSVMPRALSTRTVHALFACPPAIFPAPVVRSTA